MRLLLLLLLSLIIIIIIIIIILSIIIIINNNIIIIIIINGLPISVCCPVYRNVNDEKSLPLVSVSKGRNLLCEFRMRRVPIMA